MDAERVIDRMLQCTAGQIVACNVVAGVDNRLIDRSFAKDAIEWLARLAAFKPEYQAPRELVKALQILRGGDYPSSMSHSAPPPEFRLRGEAGIGVRDLTGSVSCVLPAWLLNRLISPSDLERLRGEGLVFPLSTRNFWSTAVVERWRRKPPAERRVRFSPNEALGRTRSVVWFTCRRKLAARLRGRTGRNHAQRARDLLGLVHHGRGVALAALHFPARILESQTSARPTFADAADHSRFRAWPDERRAQSDRNWGRTVDLRAVDRAERLADGCPEQVTMMIAGNDLPGDGQFEFDLLGMVDEALGTGPGVDETYVARLLGGISVADIGVRLKSYL